MEIELESMVANLQECMHRGWKEFKKGKDFDSFKAYAEFLINAGFLDHPLRSRQPNPANEFAARTIGKYVGGCLQKVGILYSPVAFPGEFRGSREVQGVDGGKVDLRTFELNLRHVSGEPYKLIVSFKHVDNPPDFPEPPSVRFAAAF